MAVQPTNIIVGAATVRVDGVDVGGTQGGVTFRKNTDWVDIDADQVAGVIKKIAAYERAFVQFVMLESTFANMQMAMNEPDVNLGGSSLVFGSAAPTPQEHTVTLTGVGINGAVRTYTFYRAVSIDEVEHMAGARDQAGMVPVNLELLKDPSNGNKFGYAVDV